MSARSEATSEGGDYFDLHYLVDFAVNPSELIVPDGEIRQPFQTGVVPFV